MQGIGDRGHQLGRLLERRAALKDPLLQVAALKELRNDVAEAVLGAAGVVDGHDIRVLELREDLGFREIGFEIIRRRDPLDVRHLDGDGAVELVVVGEIDATETAFSEQPDHAIATDLGRVAAGKRRWKGGGPSWVEWRGGSVVLVHRWYRSRRRCR